MVKNGHWIEWIHILSKLLKFSTEWFEYFFQCVCNDNFNWTARLMCAAWRRRSHMSRRNVPKCSEMFSSQLTAFARQLSLRAKKYCRRPYLALFFIDYFVCDNRSYRFLPLQKFSLISQAIYFCRRSLPYRPPHLPKFDLFVLAPLFERDAGRVSRPTSRDWDGRLRDAVRTFVSHQNDINNANMNLYKLYKYTIILYNYILFNVV